MLKIFLNVHYAYLVTIVKHLVLLIQLVNAMLDSFVRKAANIQTQVLVLKLLTMDLALLDTSVLMELQNQRSVFLELIIH